MQAQKTPKEQVERFIEEMNNYDPDLQEMGAKYLCEFVLSDKVNLIEDPELARKITVNFLKQVASQSFVVHSSAIRFLAEMVPKLPKNELIHIFSETIGSIAKVDTPSDRREVFSTAAGTMIHLAPDDFGHALSDLLVGSINHLIMANGKNMEIEMLLLNVITEFTRKWPNVAGSSEVRFNRKGFIEYLLKNIENSSKLLLIRKSEGALGKICIIFTREDFAFLFNEARYGLLSFIRKNMHASNEDNLKQLRNGMMCLAQVFRATNSEMRGWVKELTLLCLEAIEAHRQRDSYPEIVTEIIENSISCLTYILRAYSSEIPDLINNKQNSLHSFVEDMLDFDLEGMMMYIEEGGMDEEDEYEDDQYNYSDDSICWKVRSTALRYVTTLMHKDKGFRDNKAKQTEFLNKLSTKLIEENQSVSKSAFECFNYIIKSISTPKNAEEFQDGFNLKRVKSSERDFALDIVEQISDQISILFKNKKTKEEIKVEASKTLLQIIELLKDLIKEDEKLNNKLLDLVLSLTSKVSIDSCINLLRATRSLMSEMIGIKKIEDLTNFFFQYIKNGNTKVVATAFSGIRTIIQVYGVELVKIKKFRPILDVILSKMKELDADKIVKNSVIKCLGPIASSLLAIMDQGDQMKFLEALEVKLRVQIDKVLILSQINRLPKNFPIKKPQQKVFDNLLQLTSENLGTVNYELNYNAIESTDRLIHIKKSSLTDKVVEQVLNKCRPLLYEGKIPSFLTVLLETHPKAFKEYVELIVRTADSDYITGLIQHKVTNPSECLSILKEIAKPENSKKISLILSKLNISKKELEDGVNREAWGLISLGALGYVGDLTTSKFLLKLVDSSQHEQVKFESARALGNIASRNTRFCEQLINYCKNAKDSYLYIFAIKQMLHFSAQEFPELPRVIEFLLNKAEEDNIRETNQYVISESIGEVSRISPRELAKLLNSLKGSSELRKFVIVNSLRYALEGKNPENEEISESTENYITAIMEQTFDKSLNVKSGAMKSLNSIVNGYRFAMESFFSPEFLANLLDSLVIKPENIIIVDYGVNKERKDLGKPLRTEGYNFLAAILNNRKLEPHYEVIIRNSLDKINEEFSNDLIFKRINVIRRICEKDFTLFIPYEHEFQVKLGVQEGVLKGHQVKTAMDDERNEGYLKSLLKEVLQIQRIADKEGNNNKIRAFVNNIKQIERLRILVQKLQK